MRHTIVPAPERNAFLERFGAARKHYTSAGCRYWLFEEVSLPGAYLEFFEAEDSETLQRAHQGAPEPIAESARMYVEVDLT
jgi:hypothetical protein